MIKTLIIGVWISAVALGSVYGAIMMAKPGPDPEEVERAEFIASLTRIDSSVISVPVLANDKVHGYFLTQISYLVDPKDLEHFPFTPQEMLNDILITEFIGNNIINFPDLTGFNLDDFRKAVGDALNERIGKDVFHDIVIGRLDYLGKEDIRSNIRQKRYDMKDGAEEIQDEAAE